MTPLPLTSQAPHADDTVHAAASDSAAVRRVEVLQPKGKDGGGGGEKGRGVTRWQAPRKWRGHECTAREWKRQ